MLLLTNPACRRSIKAVEVSLSKQLWLSKDHTSRPDNKIARKRDVRQVLLIRSYGGFPGRSPKTPTTQIRRAPSYVHAQRKGLDSDVIGRQCDLCADIFLHVLDDLRTSSHVDMADAIQVPPNGELYAVSNGAAVDHDSQALERRRVQELLRSDCDCYVLKPF